MRSSAFSRQKTCQSIGINYLRLIYKAMVFFKLLLHWDLSYVGYIIKTSLTFTQQIMFLIFGNCNLAIIKRVPNLEIPYYHILWKQFSTISCSIFFLSLYIITSLAVLLLYRLLTLDENLKYVKDHLSSPIQICKGRSKLSHTYTCNCASHISFHVIGF